LLGIPSAELLKYFHDAAKALDFLNSARHDLGNGLVAVHHCDIKPANIMLMGDGAVIDGDISGGGANDDQALR